MFGLLKPLAKVIYHLVMTLEHQHRALELVAKGNKLLVDIDLEAAKTHLEQGKKQAEALLKMPFKDWSKD